MTKQSQKIIEKLYAGQAGKFLSELWEVEEFPPDEEDWPDLIVKTKSERFGLEVRQLFLDESNKGSAKKEGESNRLQCVKRLADAYYKRNDCPVKVDLSGDISHHEQILNVIIEAAPELSEFKQKQIEVYSGCVVCVTRLPEELHQYKIWRYVTDKVGWVSKIDKNIVDMAINEKAKNILKYKKNISDVRLLLVSNRIFNSGKYYLDGNVICDGRGFDKVYYFSYPQEARQIA